MGNEFDQTIEWGYQLQLMSHTIIEPYNCHTFRPLMKINKQLLINIPETVHGTYIGMMFEFYSVIYDYCPVIIKIETHLDYHDRDRCLQTEFCCIHT